MISLTLGSASKSLERPEAERLVGHFADQLIAIEADRKTLFQAAHDAPECDQDARPKSRIVEASGFGGRQIEVRE